MPELRATALLPDTEVRDLLEIVRHATQSRKKQRATRTLFDPTLHPRGIKELAAPPAMRMAAALVDLLGSLDDGSANERIDALRAVRQEALHNRSDLLPVNTARVLIEVLKDMVRSVGDTPRQADLARDFLEAATGKPRLVRRLLKRYHLLELPEEDTHIAYDHRVYDASSTGRKTPTHLILDAWLKGIRFLGVVYYNHVPPHAADELLQAGEIMGVKVHVGVDLTARFRGRPARILVFPRGFNTRQEYLEHLEQPDVAAFMEEGRQVTARFHDHVLRLLDTFNAVHVTELNDELGLDVSPLDRDAFLAFVGTGQASRLHLAEFIHDALLPRLRARAAALREEGGDHGALLATMDALVPEEIKARFLSVHAHPELGDPLDADDDPDAPAMLSSRPRDLVERITRLPFAARIVLSPTGLSAADVLEIVYNCRGRITHLELFNLRDQAEHRNPDLAAIDQLRRVLNDGNIIELKRLVRGLLDDVERSELPDRDDRATRLRQILGDLPRVQSFYTVGHRLGSRLSSGSTGRSRRSRGMGLVVMPTLDARSRRRVRKSDRLLPLRTTAVLCVTHHPAPDSRLGRSVVDNPVLLRLFGDRRQTWTIARNSTRYEGARATDGNIASLGGVPEDLGNGLLDPPSGPPTTRSRLAWRRLPGRARLLAKVLIGFLPAFLTFFLTQDWWVLAWFGAVIWFGITGLRNVIQSVVGGGGVSRSPLLRWRDLVSWSRVADSLLFTGFSVPLLDYLVKTLLLDRTLHVTVSTAPVLLYTVIALANGVYISSHNTFRGLPRAAIIGNFFRSVLSIPVAIAYSALAERALLAAGVPTDTAMHMLQLGAAVLSKAASDTVAGLIEGSADRARNVSRARQSLDEKLDRFNAIHARLEVLLPESSVIELIEKPKKLVRTVRSDSDAMVQQTIVNALDLMYFWYYQPRAQTVFKRTIATMSSDEREVLLGLQRVLERKRLVSELLLGGLVGRRFEDALSFYLNRVDRYIASLSRLPK